MAILPLETMCPRYSTDGSSEFTFFELAVLLVVVEFLHDLFDVVYVFVFGR